LKNEIKFWYIKKQQLNKVLYNLHLENGHVWKNLWTIINQSITEKVEQEMKTKYDTINNKIKKLKEEKRKRKKTTRVINVPIQ
jgi:hypothetical protein